nr:FecR domain-containing protein [Pedobacter sp. ASV19]
MEENQRISDLLTKYLNNTCNQDEFDEFIRLIRTNQDMSGLDAAMKLNWERARTEQLPYHKSWKEVSPGLKARKINLWPKSNQLKYAAVLVVAIFGAYLLSRPLRSDLFQENNSITQHTAPMEIKVVTLEDGTIVTLNSNTDLRYPKKFDKSTREVYLKGEAYFQVKHDDKKAFIIHSGKLKTQVLGTTFTVTAYNENEPMNVSVLTGKVSVKDEVKDKWIILTRGQSASTIKDHSGFNLIQMSNPEEAICWLEDKLIFDNLTLEECALRLSNKFGVKIKIENTRVSKKRITAIFQKKTLPNILNAITKLTHSSYKQQNDVYIIY